MIEGAAQIADWTRSQLLLIVALVVCGAIFVGLLVGWASRSPSRRMGPPRQIGPPEFLSEFRVGSDRYAFELRKCDDRGVEVLFLLNDQLYKSRTCWDQPDGLGARTVAIVWAEAQRKVIEGTP